MYARFVPPELHNAWLAAITVAKLLAYCEL